MTATIPTAATPLTAVPLVPPASSRFRGRPSKALQAWLARRGIAGMAPHLVQPAPSRVREHRAGTEAALREALGSGDMREVIAAMRAIGGGVAVWYHQGEDRWECRWSRRYGRYTSCAIGSPWAAIAGAAERGLAEEPKGGMD